MAIKAPFRFARINRWVHFPDWSDQVSHNLPFADGYCGEIEFTLTTRTPLLLGGARKKGAPGEVWPFVGPDGRHAISGSSIQGMVRSILEVASFGKLGPVVAKRRFGVRDLTGGSETADSLYKRRMAGTENGIFVPKSKSAWIRSDGKGGVQILRCKVARIEMDQVAQGPLLAKLMRDGKNRDTLTWKDAPGRYAAFLAGRSVSALDMPFRWPEGYAGPHRHSPGLIRYEKCIAADGQHAADFAGTLVLTGKTSSTRDRNDQNINHTKHMEFVFHGPSRAETDNITEWKELPPEVWQDFLLIHDQNTGKNAQPNPNWEFWKREFEERRPVPVFYLGDDTQVTAMGTAQMFKLAMALSTHDLLKNSAENHLDTERFDLPALIFGATGERDGKDSWYAYNLKRRASFDMAVLLEGREVAATRNDPAVLLSPKPNYYPIYVRQAARTDNRLERGLPYAAYAVTRDDASETRNPELSGAKIWPNSGSARIRTHNDNQLMAVSNRLNALPTNTTFKCRLRVHNLREAELGAVLWAMSFGEEAAFGTDGTPLRHRIGAGKPFGMGEVEIGIGLMRIERNDREPGKTGPELLKAFGDHMRKQPKLSDWENSAQVRALRKAAEVMPYTGVNELDYLDGYRGYAEERQARSIFPDFLKDEPGVVELRGEGRAVGGAQGGPAEPRTQAVAIASDALELGRQYKNGPQAGKLVRINPNGRMVTLQRADRGRVEVARVGLVRND